MSGQSAVMTRVENPKFPDAVSHIPALTRIRGEMPSGMNVKSCFHTVSGKERFLENAWILYCFLFLYNV